MGKTKETFTHEREQTMLQVRDIEMMQYSPAFTKRDAVKAGAKAAKEILDRGEVTPINALSNVARLKEFFNSLEKELRGKIEIFETVTENGVEFSMRNSGDRLDYEADELYAELKQKLKDRESLLKTAYKAKETFYDSDGVEVPKVPIKTHGKLGLTLKF